MEHGEWGSGIVGLYIVCALHGNHPSAAHAAATPFQEEGLTETCKPKGSFLKGAVAAVG